MRKYADKIFVIYVIIVVICLFVEAPFMTEAEKLRDESYKEFHENWQRQYYENLKKEFEPESDNKK